MWSDHTFNRHPGESRDPLNSARAGSAARTALIQWTPACAGVMNEKETA
jgi:hypothetical protein